MPRAMRLWHGNHGGTHRGMIVAPSKIAAASLLHVSRYEFNNFWSEADKSRCPFFDQIKPLTLYTAQNSRFGWGEFGDWFEGDLRFKKCET